MPWWERRMWIEKINAEFAPPEDGSPGDGPAQGAEVYASDDISDFGITAQSLA